MGKIDGYLSSSKLILSRTNQCAAEADRAVIENDGLARGDGALRLRERNCDFVIF
jgi:hypothetical protein